MKEILPCIHIGTVIAVNPYRINCCQIDKEFKSTLLRPVWVVALLAKNKASIYLIFVVVPPVKSRIEAMIVKDIM